MRSPGIFPFSFTVLMFISGKYFDLYKYLSISPNPLSGMVMPQISDCTFLCLLKTRKWPRPAIHSKWAQMPDC